MAKSIKKKIKNADTLKINGSFEDVIAASVSNIDLKKQPKKSSPKKKSKY